MRVDGMEKTNTTDIRKALRDKIYAYANDRGFGVYEDNVENIIDGLIENNEELGGYYCPCRVVLDNEHYKKAIVCPCLYAPREIERYGRCKCKLLYGKKKE
jgi:ferredoxin-thioredoxin reductase catalytic subunit